MLAKMQGQSPQVVAHLTVEWRNNEMVLVCDTVQLFFWVWAMDGRISS
jgi:hypothetical protein